MLGEKYKTILADPPYQQTTGSTGYKTRPNRPKQLPYPTMSIEEISNLPIEQYADIGCHLWLWTTNQFIWDSFKIMESWGFKYLCLITWIKPSGIGNWFSHRTQHILFGYYKKCIFNKAKRRPNVIFAPALKHSQKPNESYELIESISEPPYLELFARKKRVSLFGEPWDIWGDEVESDIDLKSGLK